MRNEMRLEFLSKSQNEAFTRVVIAAFAAQMDPTLEEIADIKTAVSEAVTNAIIHGYEDELGTVIMAATIDGNQLKIIIEDKGKGIEDIELAKQPLYTSKPELERSGMGFTIIENFMDEMRVFSAPGAGTKVVMIKNIKQKA
jgi:stage II sporulation protein AB (anti-sigma F factor)